MSYMMCRRADHPNIEVALDLDAIAEINGSSPRVPWASTVTSLVRTANSTLDHEFMEHPWIIAKALWDSGRGETVGAKEALDGKWGYPWEMPT